MRYIGTWKLHSVGIIEDDELKYITPEEYIASPMPYIDESDAEAVNDEISERKTTVGMEIRVLADGNLMLLVPFPESATKEEIDAAVAAGEISVLDGMMCDKGMPWEERDGALWFDSGITGEAFGEKTDSWVKATDEDGFFHFMTFRFVKAVGKEQAMGILDQLKRTIGNAIKKEAVKTASSVVSGIGKGRNRTESFTFAALPTTVAELAALPEAKMDSAFKTAALTIAVLCHFEKNPEETFAMLDFLKGPENVSPYEKQFITERLKDKGYKMRAFFQGATTANGYVPTQPFTVSVMENPYSFDNEHWATLWVKSAGADNPSSIKFRQKPSTGEWFLNDIQCLSDIRLPAAEDKWA